MTKYIFEKDSSMPLCAFKDKLYFNYLNGEVITNKHTLNFIEEGLKRKSMEIREIDLVIYEISGIYIGSGFVGYNYVINGCSNYLSENKQPLTHEERRYVVDNLMEGSYMQELIWGGLDE